MATFGPDLPPRTGHHELQVLDVHFARRAQRRLAQNAAAARLEASSPLELEEACLDDPPAADVISSDEDISVVETRATEAQTVQAPQARQGPASSRARSRSRGRQSGVVSSGPIDLVELDQLDPPGIESAATSALPSFYVHTFEYGDMARCCSSCREFFLPGQLRLGFLLHSAQDDEAIWMHAPRCLRRGNFEVSLLESVAFDTDLSDQVRARVLEELAAINARHTEARWPGQARAAVQATKPWHCNIQRLDERMEPAWSVAWSVVRVPLPVVQSEPASRPGLAARAARSTLHAAHEARWAAIDAQLERADELTRDDQIPDALTQLAPASRPDDINDLLASVPCQKLEVACQEPCAVCYEEMVVGEEIRRLPCLHNFHRACIDRWIKVKATCPLDNLNVRDLIAKQREGTSGSSQ